MHIFLSPCHEIGGKEKIIYGLSMCFIWERALCIIDVMVLMLHISMTL